MQNIEYGKYSSEVLSELKPYEKDYTFSTIRYRIYLLHLLIHSVINLDYLNRYFESSERKTIKVREATFELLLGNNFNYDLYRKEILTDINRDFYAIPEWLPVGQCEFKYKYGFM